jgi:hypothetical protein
MRRNILFMGVFFGMFLMAPRAFAVSYSGSVFLDLNTLSFSGIGITPINDPFSQYQIQSTGIILDPHSTNPDRTGTSFFDTNWTSHTLLQNSPELGTAVSIANGTGMYAAASLTGQDIDVTADIFRQRTFSANSTGYLTANIQYSLLQGGVANVMGSDSYLAGNLRVWFFIRGMTISTLLKKD